MPTAIEFENISKQYRLGLVSTRTLSHDLKRWYAMNIQGKDDPYLKIGEVNDRAHRGESEYVWALKDINFKVEQGDVLGIIGKNGAGKSTLLKILSKVTTPSTGTIKARGRIASLLEVGTGFHPEMTGRENIYMNGAIMGMTKAEISRKFDEIVDFSGVERYIDTPAKRYSSGMTVRLGFAIAAHLDPEILVVDEVLAVGDAEFQKKAIGKMQDVSKGEGRTVLFVSHNMTAVKSLCQKGVVLENGNVSFKGTIEETVDFYLNGNQINYNSLILENLKIYSHELSISSVFVNNSKSSTLNLNYPERSLNVRVEGFCLNKIKVALELLIYDSNENLLAKYAPPLKNGNSIPFQQGEFLLDENINLPLNMANGEYKIQIDITHPNVEYLARIPDAVLLIVDNFMGETGIPFNYNNTGFLLL
jgi:lipopolysaccharide transport system ATP-binding protein